MDETTLIAVARQLDLDHVGTHVREHRRRLGALDQQAGLENPNAVERSIHLEVSRGARSVDRARSGCLLANAFGEFPVDADREQAGGAGDLVDH